jgi:hypothetical protein
MKCGNTLKYMETKNEYLIFVEAFRFSKNETKVNINSLNLYRLMARSPPVLRSRIIFMRLRLRVKILMRLRRLRVKILMRLRLLPYCLARQNF